MLLSSSKPEVEVDHGKSPSKASNDQPYLDIPLQSSLARSSDPISDISIYSADNEHERRTRGPLLALPPPSWTGKIESWWSGNKGLALVILAQLFSVMMNVTTRLLELDGIDGPGMHPFQVCILWLMHSLHLCAPARLSGTQTTDIGCPNDCYPGPQRYVSVAGQGRTCSFRIERSTSTVGCSRRRWVFWRSVKSEVSLLRPLTSKKVYGIYCELEYTVAMLSSFAVVI